MRIHEYPLETPARLAYAVRWGGAGISVGGAIGFLVALGAAITLDEAFHDLWREVELDPLSRSVIPLLFVTLGVGLLIWALGDSAHRWLFGRQLARAARETPRLVPTHAQRSIIASDSPFAGTLGVIWTIFGLAALVALAFFAILGETSDDEVPFVLGVAVGAVALGGAMVGASIVVRGWAKRRWNAMVQDARTAWSRHTVREAEEADRARRPRGEKIGPSRVASALSAFVGRMLAVGLGIVVFGAAVGFLGVLIRQPCRRCDERYYGNFGEAVIDNLAVIGSAVTALGALVLVIVGLAASAASIITDRALRDGITGMDAQRRPAGGMLQQRLMATSLAESYSILFSALGAVIATASLAVTLIDFPVDKAILDAALVGGMTLLAIALVLAYAGVGYNLRLRSQLRERWAPADIPVPTSPRKRR